MNEPTLTQLIGKTIKKIFMNHKYLKFETNKGTIVYGVDGDCCSYSHFYDFYGIKNLLNNGPIITTQRIEIDSKTLLNPGDDHTEAYGFQLTTMSPEFGEVTSVFSFRNESNGYYGGSLTNEKNTIEVSPEITDDILEIKTP